MIHHGDLFVVLRTVAPDSIDAVVTDPPYGIGFMGKAWDTFSPEVVNRTAASGLLQHPLVSDNPNLHGRTRSPAVSRSQIGYDFSADGLLAFQIWTRDWATAAWRVMKPGAYMLVHGGPRSYHRMACGLEDAGFEIRDCLVWLFGQGFPKSLNIGDGRGTALKPAYEPIVLARKPFNGTVTANVQKFGTGALNIDACRVEGPPSQGGTKGSKTALGLMNDDGGQGRERVIDRSMSAGRWPANVLLDEDAAAMLDEQSGESVSNGGRNPIKTGITLGTFEEKEQREFFNYGDRGGASRFYYVAKPSREERDYGTHGLTTKPRDDSRKEGNPGGDNPRNRGLQPRGNFHPTVKPVELMRWLVKLVTPPGGTVLDPFLGSGTTGMACRYEQREFIGIEREAEYLAIAEHRIAAVAPLFSAEGA